MAGTTSTLQLYNTLTREKKPFEPLDPAHVRMYVCGPTVYDFAHIGNARPVIVFDVLYRLLSHLAELNAWGAPEGEKPKVTYVRNITDVDDKINARALRDFPDLPLNEAIAKVTQKTADQFQSDVAALGCLEPDKEPRATENIQQMQDMIAALIAKGHAYEAEGEVLFDTASMADYGQLSNRNLDEQQAGARVDVEAHKRNAADFVLWKASSETEPGWDSPWGRGRPGWHIECSAMSNRYLWDAVADDLSDEAKAHAHEFDIHGGGLDLIFPHHENEIAQSRCAHGAGAMARVWMHNGFLQVEGEKMSKSLGNFITINELLATDTFGGKRWLGDVLRMTMLRTHYRQPIDWTQAALQENQKAYGSFGNVIRDVSEAEEHDKKFMDMLCDDLNTPGAFKRLFELRNDAVNHGGGDSARKLRKALVWMGFFRKWTFKEEITIPIRQGSWDLDDIIPHIVEVNSEFELSKVSDHFKKKHAQKSKGVVNFLDRFGSGTTVGDLKLLQDQWMELVKLDGLRHAARAAKDWAEGDRIRDELLKMGIQLKDAKNPETGEIETTWDVKR